MSAPDAEHPERVVNVPLGGDRAYSVHIGQGLLGSCGRATRQAAPDAARAMLIIDSGLPDRWVETARTALSSEGIHVFAAAVEPHEREKSMASVHRLLCEMAEHRFERSDVVVALGGGITGDVAGFVASAYRRGVGVVQCPTTLLAMVDASVGGKTGVNLQTSSGLKKNLAGAFWQPRRVLIDVDVLETLDPRQLRAGMAECIKHSHIASCVPSADPALGAWMGEHADRLLTGETALLAELIERNVRIKASVVAADEREEQFGAGVGRALLNLGHTFGHALEVIETLSPDGDPSHAPLMHGEAVALGLVAAGACSRKLGLCSADIANEIERSVERFGLCTRVGPLPESDSIIDAMMHDKKVAGGLLRLVLPDGTGSARVVENPDRAAVRAGVDALRG